MARAVGVDSSIHFSTTKQKADTLNTCRSVFSIRNYIQSMARKYPLKIFGIFSATAYRFIGPISWGHSGPHCHALSLLSLSLLSL